MEPNYIFFISHIKVLEVERLLSKLFQATDRLSTNKNLNHFPLAEEIENIGNNNVIKYKDNKSSHALTRRDDQKQSFSLETLDIRKFHELVIFETILLLNRCKLDCANALQRNEPGVTEISHNFKKVGKNYHLNFFHLSFRRLMKNNIPLFRPCNTVILRDDGTTLSYVFDNTISFINKDLFGIYKFQSEQLYKNYFFTLLFTLEEMKILIKNLAELKKRRDKEMNENLICYLRSTYTELQMMRGLKPREFKWIEVDFDLINSDDNSKYNLFASLYEYFSVEIIDKS